MNKFKMAFALLAVLVILAAPAYAQPAAFGDRAAVSTPYDGSRPLVSVEQKQFAAELGESLYAERQT